ncbi:MaoC family dehydratase [Streptomyces boninensis]|uniref:MaoC family dehydratase n=1 Tax=Streptomyces boninensis TaxID=2039455 RepID=UPI003B21D99B
MSTAPVRRAFPAPKDDRYFEDYEPGTVYEFGSVKVTEEDILEFARRYDPQVFHTDPAAAADGPYGGLIASGWHTSALFMRLYAEHFLSDVSSLGSPGVDQLRWRQPVRPGDTLRLRVEILEARTSQSKPDRGIAKIHSEVLNQDDEVVMDVTAVNLLLRRTRLGRSLPSENSDA